MAYQEIDLVMSPPLRERKAGILYGKTRPPRFDVLKVTVFYGY